MELYIGISDEEWGEWQKKGRIPLNELFTSCKEEAQRNAIDYVVLGNPTVLSAEYDDILFKKVASGKIPGYDGDVYKSERNILLTEIIWDTEPVKKE